jgi:hypothetical protein
MFGVWAGRGARISFLLSIVYSCWQVKERDFEGNAADSLEGESLRYGSSSLSGEKGFAGLLDGQFGADDAD